MSGRHRQSKVVSTNGILQTGSGLPVPFFDPAAGVYKAWCCALEYGGDVYNEWTAPNPPGDAGYCAFISMPLGAGTWVGAPSASAVNETVDVSVEGIDGTQDVDTLLIAAGGLKATIFVNAGDKEQVKAALLAQGVEVPLDVQSVFARRAAENSYMFNLAALRNSGAGLWGGDGAGGGARAWSGFPAGGREFLVYTPEEDMRLHEVSCTFCAAGDEKKLLMRVTVDGETRFAFPLYHGKRGTSFRVPGRLVCPAGSRMAIETPGGNTDGGSLRIGITYSGG